MNDNVENKKTGKETGKIILFLIIIIVGFSAGYLSGKKNNNIKEEDNKTTIKDNKNEEVELDIKSEEVMGLYLPFSFHTYDVNDEELYMKDKMTVSELSPEYRNRLALAHYVVEGNKAEGKAKLEDMVLEQKYLSSKTLEKYYNELFGTDIKYIPKSFKSYWIMNLNMIYYENEGRYYEGLEAGDVTGYRFGNELYKAVKKNDTIELYEYSVVYYSVFNGEESKTGVFKSLEEAKKLGAPINELPYEMYSQATVDKNIYYKGSNLHMDDLSAYKEEASQYKLTFKLENNNYVFKSIERIK